MAFGARIQAVLEYFEITPVAFWATVFFCLTGCLLLIVYRQRKLVWAEVTAWAAVVSVAAAVYFMIAAWYEMPATQVLTMPSRTAVVDRDVGRTIRDCPECPELVVVPAGYFIMGADDILAGREEGPTRRMMVPRNMAIGRDAVTPAQFDAFVKATGRAQTACGATAAACITRADAEAYVAWLLVRTGRRYRLPSAAEWEYAGRAGAPPPSGIAEPVPAAVRSDRVRGTNGFGVAGMAQGRAEMVADCWTPTLVALASNSTPVTAPAGQRCAWFVAKRATPEASAGAAYPRFSGRWALAAGNLDPQLTFRVALDLAPSQP